ncbi:hypothetical protein V865_004485 [Kwoniella europaea PYCC6329]|uniref:Uncharacterized protein n=1 Tax=Kwoniella europaea PYCC6329 TaxID=1423913 RepID=A0AAX4KJ43_9TREE
MPPSPDPPDPPRSRHPSLRISTGRSTAPDPLPGGRAPDPTPITTTSTRPARTILPEQEVDERLQPLEGKEVYTPPPSAGPSGAQNDVHGDNGSRRSSVAVDTNDDMEGSTNQERCITRIPEEGEGNNRPDAREGSSMDMDINIDQTPQQQYTSLPSAQEMEGRSPPDAPRTPISRDFSPPTQTNQEEMSSPTFHIEHEHGHGHVHRPVPSGPTSPQFSDDSDIPQGQDVQHQHEMEVEDEPKDHMRLRGGGFSETLDRWHGYGEFEDLRKANLSDQHRYRKRAPLVSLPDDPPIVLPDFAQKRAEFLAAQKAAAEGEAATQQDDILSRRSSAETIKIAKAAEPDDPAVPSYSLELPITALFLQGYTQSERKLRLRGGSHFEPSSDADPSTGQQIGSILGQQTDEPSDERNSEEQESATYKGSKATVPILKYRPPKNSPVHPKPPSGRVTTPSNPSLKVQGITSPVKWYTKPFWMIKRGSLKVFNLLFSSKLRGNTHNPVTPQAGPPERQRSFGSDTERSDDPHSSSLTTPPTAQGEIASPTSAQGTVISTPPEQHNALGYDVEPSAVPNSPSRGDSKLAQSSALTPTFSPMTEHSPGQFTGPSGEAGHDLPGTERPSTPRRLSAPPETVATGPSADPSHPPSQPLRRSTSDVLWMDKLRDLFRYSRNRSETDTSATRTQGESPTTIFQDPSLVEGRRARGLSLTEGGTHTTATTATSAVPTIPSTSAQPPAPGPSTGPRTLEQLEEEREAWCCDWRAPRLKQTTAMERSSDQGPGGNIGSRDSRLIRLSEFLLPCIKPKVEEAERRVEEAVSAGNDDEERSEESSESRGKGKGKDRAKGKGKKKSSGHRRPRDGGGVGDGSGGPGPGGGDGGASPPAGGGNGSGQRPPKSDNGDQPVPTTGNVTGAFVDGSTSETGQTQPQQNPLSAARDSENSSLRGSTNPSNKSSSSIWPLIGPRKKPKSFPDSNRDPLIAAYLSLKPPPRSRPDSSSGRPESTILPPDSTEDSPFETNEDSLPTHTGIPTSEVVKSASGTSGKTFGKGAQTPGTGPPQNVLELPIAGRSDEGMLRSSGDNSGNTPLQPPSPPFLDQPLTQTVLGTVVRPIPGANAAPASPLGAGQPGSSSLPRSTLAESTDNPHSIRPQPAAGVAEREGTENSESTKERKKKEQEEATEVSAGPSGTSGTTRSLFEGLVGSARPIPERSITPPQGDVSSPKGSPLSSGGTSPGPLTTSRQLIHPPNVPEQCSSLDPRSTFDSETPHGSMGGLSTISEGSGEGMSTHESHGTMPTSESITMIPRPYEEPMESIGQSLDASADIIAERERQIKRERIAASTASAASTSPIGERPPTPVDKDTPVDTKGAKTGDQLSAGTHQPQEPSSSTQTHTERPAPSEQTTDGSVVDVGTTANLEQPTSDQGQGPTETAAGYHVGAGGDRNTAGNAYPPVPAQPGQVPLVIKRKWYKRWWRKAKRMLN